MCPHAHYERGTELTFNNQQGSRARFRPLEALGLFCYLSLIFKHSEEKKLDLKNIVDPI